MLGRRNFLFAQKCLVDWAVHRYIMNAEGFRFQTEDIGSYSGSVGIPT